MHTMIYSVLGSCVTRDAVEVGSDPLPKPVYLLSRTAMQSIVSAPTAIGEEVGIVSGFGTRVVKEDFRKVPIRILATLDHPLIIDLIDERFDLLDSGTGLVTNSLYLQESCVDTSGYTLIERDVDLAQDGPFATAVAQIRAHVPDVPVVIHRAFWASHQYDGELLPNWEMAGMTNPWLEGAYDILQAAFPGSVPVEVAAEHRVSDPGHHWGLAPYHYVASYYDEFSRGVRKALASF